MSREPIYVSKEHADSQLAKLRRYQFRLIRAHGKATKPFVARGVEKEQDKVAERIAIWLAVLRQFKETE